MDVTKINTQIRAEIGWLWQRETDDDVQTDSGAVRFKTYKTDIADGRLEGVWHATGKALNEDETVEYELDYLTRPTTGGTLDIGFLDVRCLLVINRGPGKLVVQPGESCGFQGPWESGFGVNVVPSGGSILLSAGDSPWKVTILTNKLRFTAQNDKCVFDAAVVGKIGDVPSSDSSSGSSGSSSASGSSSSSESISE
ncbi:MAG: hypothetical protein IJF84_05930 [Thermoguttaceae bacterium]|nr:hypothetical protein [Thermoguttaceae bacterium]